MALRTRSDRSRVARTERARTEHAPDGPTTADEPVDPAALRGGAVTVPRSRGAFSGVALMVLGAWGALIPFIGPYFNWGLRPDTAWHWTNARGWLEVLPGVVAFVGGLLSFASRNRVVISFGAWLAVLAGAWFIVGREVATWFKIGSPGALRGTGHAQRALEALTLFTGLGALILFFGATAVGRLSVRAVRDVRAAQRRDARTTGEQRTVRDSAYEQGRRDALAETGGDRVEQPQHVNRLHTPNYPDRQYADGTPQGGYPEGSAAQAAPTQVQPSATTAPPTGQQPLTPEQYPATSEQQYPAAPPPPQQPRR